MEKDQGLLPARWEREGKVSEPEAGTEIELPSEIRIPAPAFFASSWPLPGSLQAGRGYMTESNLFSRGARDSEAQDDIVSE